MAARLPYAYVPRFYEPQYDARRAADGGPADARRRAGADRAGRGGRPGRHSAAAGAGRAATSSACRTASPSRSCAAARAVPLLPEHDAQAAAAVPQGRNDRPRRRSSSIATPATTRSRSCRSRPAIIPQFDELLRRLQETFRPLGVSVSLPSLRINEQLRLVGELLNTDRHSGLTLAPEAARDDMRRQIGKPITNDDLYAGCRRALENGFSRVKLYFMCGLPGETESRPGRHHRHVGDDLAAGQGVLAAGWPTVVANVSNFVPKPQTPFQWHAMQRREYFRWAHELLRRRKRLRSVQLRCHDIESSLLEGVLCRGDRRLGEAIELAWRRGAGFDAWAEQLRPELWWQALADAGIDVERNPCTAPTPPTPLPWDHIGIRQGREYLHREARGERGEGRGESEE